MGKTSFLFVSKIEDEIEEFEPTCQYDIPFKLKILIYASSLEPDPRSCRFVVATFFSLFLSSNDLYLNVSSSFQ